MTTRLAALVLLAAAAAVVAEPPPPMPKSVEPATQPATQPTTQPAAETVEPATPSLTFAGVFVPADPAEVELDFAAYAGPVEVLEAVSHGAPVKQGDVLLKLEAPDLLEQLEAAERAVTVARAQLERAEADAALATQIDTFNLAAAEHRVGQAQQELSWFDEADGKNLLYSADLAVQSNLDSIADNEEELEQLRKMYKSEELTSDTADIVVKRAVRQLERIKERQEFVELRSRKQREFDYGVARKGFEDNIVRAEQSLAQTKIAQKLDAVTRSTGLETARVAAEKAADALADLQADAKRLTLKAPADGTVLYGQMQGEAWNTGDTDRFAAGEEFQPQGVLMSIVAPGKLQVDALLPEASRYDVEEGTTVNVTTPALDKPLAGKITTIAPTPIQRGQQRFFEVTIALETTNEIAPGSTAEVRVEGGPATRPFDGAPAARWAPAIEEETSNSRGPTARGADADDPYLQPVRRRSSIDAAIADGVAFLIADQNEDGSWGTGTETRGTEIYSMVPGSHDAFRVATTALAAMALDDTGHRASAAYRKAIAYLVSDGQARRDNSRIMYNTWAHTYALEMLSRELQRHPDDDKARAELKAAAQWQLDKLEQYEIYIGGWNYYDFEAGTQRPSMAATSFGTASALGALHEARAAGLDVPQEMIDRAVRRLAEMRTPLGTYIYSGSLKYSPQMGANRERGAVGRTQAAVWALGLYEHEYGEPADAEQALTMLEKEHAWLNMGRKRPFPHEAWYQTSGYYYYYAMYHAGLLVEELGGQHAANIAEMILPYQEEDGSFWDYAMWDYHKPYGTAYAVMALTRLSDVSTGD